MGTRGGKVENLEKRECGKKMEEKLKPARFKNRSTQRPLESHDREAGD
jgi:hypothetical protein